MDGTKVLELLITGATALAAAYGGAYFAFRYNRQHDKAKIRDANVDACNRAMLVLMRQLNWLTSFDRQFLAPIASHPVRHFVLTAHTPLTMDWHVDVSSLSFLLNTAARDIPNILGVLDQKFHATVAMINLRSDHHGEFQRKLEHSGLEVDEGVPLAAIEQAVGSRITLSLRSETDSVYALMSEALEAIGSAGLTITPVLRTIYPEAGFFRFGTDLAAKRGEPRTAGAPS